MPETRRSFIKSKMNKDLDSRIVPPGEYRDARNISISRSEGEDVGALENVLGNVNIENFKGTTPLECNLEFIGYYMDAVNDRIFVWLTDYVDTSATKLTNFTSTDSICRIYSYNVNTKVSNLLVEGPFLNFSKTHPVYGVNLLEDLLFWTDNRNQPRKINVNSAISDPTYYTTEDSISVAKYSPYNPTRLYNSVTVTNTGGAGVAANTHLLTVASTTGLEQGMRLAILSDTTGTAPSLVTLTTDWYIVGAITATQFTIKASMNNLGVIPTEAIPAFATFTLVGASMKDVVNQYLPLNKNSSPTNLSNNPYYDSDWPGDPEYLKDKFVRFSYRYKFDDGEYSLMAPFSQIAFIPQQDGYFMADIVTATGALQTPTDEHNDENRAYRTTEVGFAENKVNNVMIYIDTPFVVRTLKDNLKISDIEILYKEADDLSVKVLETIPVTDSSITANTTSVFSYNYQSRQPWKTLSERETIRVYDAVPVRAKAQEVSGNRVIYGNFINKHSAPTSLEFYTKIDKKFTVFENGQAIVENGEVLDYNTYNAVEYPNHTIKQNRTYQIGIVLADRFGRQSDVILSSVTADQVLIGGNYYGGSTLYHPYQSNSAVPVLADNALYWFGDSLKMLFLSGIPSTITGIDGYPGLYTGVGEVSSLSITATGSGYGAVTPLYNVATTGGSGTGLTVDITIALGALVTATINNPGLGYKLSDIVTVTGGGGDGTLTIEALATPNTLGWYSYRTVVKQSEQEYYNAYLPGILDGYPTNSSMVLEEQGVTANIVLIGDNINKIPKDLQDVGPNQNQFRSSVRLYGRVENISVYPGNQQFYPGNTNVTLTNSTDLRLFDTPVALGTYIELDLGTVAAPEDEIYQAITNPWCARISTQQPIGAIAAVSWNTELAVYETDPVESKLDIYWETTSSGLVSDLNTYIEANDVTNAYSLGLRTGVGTTSGITPVYDGNEADASGTTVIPQFYPLFKSGLPIPTTGLTSITMLVTDGLGNNRTNDFRLVSAADGAYTVFHVTNWAESVCLNDTNIRESYTFSFDCTVPTPLQTRNIQLAGTLGNTSPTISGCPGGTLNKAPGELIDTITAVNGSAAIISEKLELTAEVLLDTYSPTNYFYIGREILPGQFDLYSTGDTPTNTTYELIIQVQDGLGASDECSVTVTINPSS